MSTTDYGIIYSDKGRESLRQIPADCLLKVIDIQNALAQDPHEFPDRLIPAGDRGETFIYIHPIPRFQITFTINEDSNTIKFFHFSLSSFDLPETLFVSYSHKDQEWFDEIMKFLSSLTANDGVKFVDDTQIPAGAEWEAKIQGFLESATAAVLLVSENFLASNYVREKELPKLLKNAEKNGTKIFWVPVTASTVFESHPGITKFQSPLENPKISLDELDPPQQKRALVEISKQIRAAITIH